MPELPNGWVWASSEMLAEGGWGGIVIGPFGSNLKVSNYTASGVPLVFVRHIRSHDFAGIRPQFISAVKARELAAHEAEPGDILITKMGDPPGDAAIYPSGFPNAVITADCIRWRPTPLMNTSFLEMWVNSFWASLDHEQDPRRGAAENQFGIISRPSGTRRQPRRATAYRR
ncbi:MAG: hypothetical protein H0X27_00970 [Caulobacteraceae bacterium]|nr:hypothetical protein [Caulobacteraceae bacterium]